MPRHGRDLLDDRPRVVPFWWPERQEQRSAVRQVIDPPLRPPSLHRERRRIEHLERAIVEKHGNRTGEPWVDADVSHAIHAF